MKRNKRPGKGPLPEPPGAVRSALAHALASFPSRPPRDLALPMLQAAQVAAGWLSPEVIAWVSRRTRIPVADLTGIATFYELLATQPQGQTVIRVCDDLACAMDGRAGAVLAALEHTLGISPGQTTPDGRFTLHTSACLGGCDRGPCMLVNDTFAGPVTPADAAELAQRPEPTAPPAAPPAYGWLPGRAPVLLARVGRIDPASAPAYAAAGGWEGLRRAVALGPEGVIAAVKAAQLVGRGGAAFPTGIKWEGAARARGNPKYVVLNADESEPGTYTNRLVLEQDPLSVIEGMLIAAFAVGATRGYAYIRGEYALAVSRFAAAVEAARAAGLLGRAILGQDGFDFDIEIRRGAGAYICGEETALFASIEGYRGEPRVKPPFPTTDGLFGQPTVINNVETLICVPALLCQGPEAFAGAPPKLFAVSGHVRRPGVYEAPLGTPLRRLLEESAGGAVGTVQAVLMGGAAGMFLRPDQLDVPLDFGSLKAAGATLGSGAAFVFNDTVDLWQVAARLARFFADESCGKCIPCRLGTARQLELVRHIGRGGDADGATALLHDLGAAMADASICGLGQTASWPILSLVSQFGPPAARGGPGR